jgi:hypothetical protein
MVTAPLARLASVERLRSIARDELASLAAKTRQAPKLSPLRSLKHLVSSDVRQALRKDPLLARVDATLRKSVTMLGSAVEDRLRASVGGPPPVPRPPSGSALNVGLSAQQLRGVWHSSERARAEIGYAPPQSFAASMRAFERWFRAHAAMDTAYWPLYRRLWFS